MKKPEDFPFPLDTDIEEQIPVKKIGVDIDENGNAKVSVKTVLEKQTVRYINAPKEKYRCKDGEHLFRVFNAGKWMFACINCPFVRKVLPTSHRFDLVSKKLINRRTGQAV